MVVHLKVHFKPYFVPPPESPFRPDLVGQGLIVDIEHPQVVRVEEILDVEPQPGVDVSNDKTLGDACAESIEIVVAMVVALPGGVHLSELRIGEVVEGGSLSDDRKGVTR